MLIKSILRLQYLEPEFGTPEHKEGPELPPVKLEVSQALFSVIMYMCPCPGLDVSWLIPAGLEGPNSENLSL